MMSSDATCCSGLTSDLIKRLRYVQKEISNFKNLHLRYGLELITQESISSEKLFANEQFLLGNCTSFSARMFCTISYRVYVIQIRCLEKNLSYFIIIIIILLFYFEIFISMPSVH